MFDKYGRPNILVVLVFAVLTFAGCGTSPQSKSSTSSNALGTAQITPAHLTFGDQVVSSQSSPASVTFANNGTANLSLSGIIVSGDFSQTNNCGATLAPFASCSVSVLFKPHTTGSRTGALTFTDNAETSPQVVTLGGTGVTAGKLSGNPGSVAFGTVSVGQSATQLLTILNAGGQTVTLTSVGTSGAGVNASPISTPLTLAPNQSTSLSVSFSPAATGTVSGTVYFVNDATASPFVVPVTGTGSNATHQVVVSWNNSVSASGYRVYRSQTSGGPYSEVSSLGSQTSYTDWSVIAGSTYYYVVTAVDSNLQESSYSAEVHALIPTP